MTAGESDMEIGSGYSVMGNWEPEKRPISNRHTIYENPGYVVRNKAFDIDANYQLPITNDQCSQIPPEPQFVGALTEKCDHVADVLFERETELVGALAEILARHAARERLVFHALHD